MLVELADDARPDVGAPVEELLLDLVLDDLAPLLDDQHLVQPFGEMPDGLRLQRPGHADLEDAQADRGHFLRTDLELAQRLQHVLIGLARGDDAEAGIGHIMGDFVDAIGAGEGDRGIALVGLQPIVLHQRRIGPAQVEPAGRQLEIGRQHELPLLARRDRPRLSSRPCRR